jgi:hypothetical protein
MTMSIIPGQEPFIAPGVRGCVVVTASGNYVPLVFAEHPRTGAVGRFLDSLDAAKTWKFPTVVSAILVGMLKRRGFLLTVEKDPDWGDIEVWCRMAGRTGRDSGGTGG